MGDTEKAPTSNEIETMQKAVDALREVVGESRRLQSKLDQVMEEYRTLFETMMASHAPEGSHGPGCAVCRSLAAAQKRFGSGMPPQAKSSGKRSGA